MSSETNGLVSLLTGISAGGDACVPGGGHHAKPEKIAFNFAATNKLQPTSCNQQATTNKLQPTSCNQQAATNKQQQAAASSKKLQPTSCNKL